MKIKRNNAIAGRPNQRGFTFVELLVAAMLMSISLMALVNIWAFSYRMTADNDDRGIAYNIGRITIETVKVAGFTNAVEGSTTTYYDAYEAVRATAASPARFRVVTSIVSSAVKSGTIGAAGAVPADTAYRTVTITVTRLTDSKTLYTTGSYLVRAGI